MKNLHLALVALPEDALEALIHEILAALDSETRKPNRQALNDLYAEATRARPARF